jgi:multiple antibiotic resistance protein
LPSTIFFLLVDIVHGSRVNHDCALRSNEQATLRSPRVPPLQRVASPAATTSLLLAVSPRQGKSGGNGRMGFELSYGDIGILFFLTLGPLKAILPFARVTRGTEPAFRRTVAWRAVAIATAIVIGVALLGPFVLTNWHVSPPAIAITCGIILFSQALRIIMQTPAAVLTSANREASQSPASLAIAVFPLAIPAIVTAPGIAALAAIIVLNRDDLAHQTIVVALLLGVMVLNLLTLRNTETILKRGFAAVLPIVGWVLAVLQASLAVQIVIYSLRALEVLHWPAS